MEIPGFQIGEKIGAGGMASVYLAVQESLHRKVALKVLTPGLAVDESYCQRFLKEGRIAAQLSHINVMTVYDIGVHDNHYYMAMEYLSAGSVRDRMKTGLTEEQIVRIIADIARGLNYAHAKGFVHRDVKPGNMLFRDDDVCVLGDFGIAKAVDSETGATKIGTSIGTPHYMSPEQARGEKVDHRTDLYSLGVAFYELLAGRPPFEAADPFAVALKQISEPTPKVPECYSRYQPLINRLMEKDREARYEVAATFVEELAQTTDFHLSGSITAVSQEVAASHATAGAVTEQRTGVNGNSSAQRWLLVGSGLLIALVVGAYALWPSSETATQADTKISKEPALPPSDPGLAEPLQEITESPDPEISSLLQRAEDRLRTGQFITEDRTGAIGLFQDVLLLAPDSPDAESGLRVATEGLLDAIHTLREAGDLESAGSLALLGSQRFAGDTRFMIVAAQIRSEANAPREPDTDRAAVADSPAPTSPPKPRPDPRRARIAQLVQEGDAFYRDHKYGLPPGENATDRYQAVLKLAPGHPHATERLAIIAASWADAAQSLMDRGKPERALGMVELGLQANAEDPRLLEMKRRIDEGQTGGRR